MGISKHRRIAFGFIVGTSALVAAALGIRSTGQFAPNHISASAGSGDQELLGRASRAFNTIAHEAMPAVVSISTIRRAEPSDSLIPGHPGLKAPTPPFPGGAAHPPGGGNHPDPRMLGLGSGIIIRPDGLVLTNNHVVENAERVTVTLDEKHKAKAHVVGTDPKTDLAVVQIDEPRKDYPVIGFGNSDQIREGDWAIAIGSPFGLNHSVSFGIISAKGRAQMGILDVEDFIQTDAAINPGSSGGPLLNAKGELVGVNTAIFSQSGGNMGIGFAIPSRIAREISQELIANGRVSRGWAGLMAQDLDADLAKFFGVSAAKGALVSEVVHGGPASQAELHTGDVVTQFNHQPVDSASTLKSLVGKAKAGAQVPVEVMREGKPMSVTLAMREQPGPLPAVQQAGQAASKAEDGRIEKKPVGFGLNVEDVPSELSSYFHLPPRQGTLVVGVNPGSPAFDAGIGPGDIILSANRREIHGAQEFKRLSRELTTQPSPNAKGVTVLYVQRGPVERVYVPVKLGDSEA